MIVKVLWSVLLIARTSQGSTKCDVSTATTESLFELSVIHLNDFHARFVQTSPSSDTCEEDREDECVGGIARVYTAVNELMERPNAIFLNAGDHFQGTLWYNVHRWNVTATFMNMLPHDAMTIGNHEFDNKIAGLVPFLQTVNAPVVVTNIDDSEEPDMKGLYANSTVIVRSGKKIGVIGVILSTMNEIASTEKLKFFDEVVTVNDEAEKLKAQGVDIIIALSHCGLNVDRIIAAKCPNVDLIVGGHTHTFLYTGKAPDTDKAEDKYPVVVTQEGTNRTVLIVQAYAFTKYLGNLTAWFDSKGEIVNWEGNPILLDSSFEQNAKILEALKPWQVEVDALNDKKIGESKVDLINDICYYGECNIGNLVSDSMVNAWVDEAENKTYWTYAAIGCITAGGIRSSIKKRSGIITYGDLLTVLPFGNNIDVVELKGSAIRQFLEYGVSSSYSTTEFSGPHFLHCSGINAVYNISNPVNSRVVDIKVRCRACDKPVFEELVEDEWYRVAIPNYYLRTGNTIIRDNHRNHVVGTLDIDNLVEYVRKISPVTYGTDSRAVILGTWNG